MLEIGKVCIKIAGRDAGKLAVIVEILDEPYVLIDGEVRRRKCNILHLEPTERKVEIKKDASHLEVVKALGITEVKKKKVKKDKTSRPTSSKVKKVYDKPKIVKESKKE